MHFPTQRPIRLLVGLLLLAAQPAFSESSPEAQKWLDKLVGIYDKGSFLLDFDGTLSLSQPGASMNGTLAGKITYGDSTHLRAVLSMRFAGAEAGNEMGMEVINIHDGETIWTEVSSPLLGGRQITRISIEEAKNLSGQPSGASGIGGSPASLDPISQLKSMTESMDFEVLRIADGQVELQAPITAETQGLGQLGSIPGIEAFVLVLEESTGHPVGFRSVGAEGSVPVITMSFENLVFVDPARLATDTFVYEVPAGAQVLDLGAGAKRQDS